MLSLGVLPATADCTDSSNQIHGLCRLVEDHSGGAAGLTVGILSWVLWPAIVLILGIALARVVRSVVIRSIERAGADAQIRTLVHNVLTAVGFVVAVGAALIAEGLDLNIFLTIGGLGTLAISLAFQDLLRNVLAGILLLVERPFRIGDAVVIDQLTGTVATIELRTTALRLTDGRLAIIPNLDAFTHTVVNLSAFEQRQFSVTLLVPEGVDLEAAIAGASAVLASTPDVAGERPWRVMPGYDTEGRTTLECRYWLDYRARDPDTVSATLYRRVHAVLAGRPALDARPAGGAPHAASDETGGAEGQA
ncbi:MAG TPA: mechanosensitive ion channel family protein, partial [Candidatus Dormibacteraeota bacterium]|nr:mechanosensitive ion channel family protein [Candidatus Dormibacteraeota bacterium]